MRSQWESEFSEAGPFGNKGAHGHVTHRNARELRGVHRGIDLVGNVLVRVREVLERLLFQLQPLHGFVEGERDAPHGIVRERCLLIALGIAVVLDVVAALDEVLIETLSAGRERGEEKSVGGERESELMLRQR
jgi:hypothetical protein